MLRSELNVPNRWTYHANTTSTSRNCCTIRSSRIWGSILLSPPEARRTRLVPLLAWVCSLSPMASGGSNLVKSREAVDCCFDQQLSGKRGSSRALAVESCSEPRMHSRSTCQTVHFTPSRKRNQQPQGSYPSAASKQAQTTDYIPRLAFMRLILQQRFFEFAEDDESSVSLVHRSSLVRRSSVECRFCRR